MQESQPQKDENYNQKVGLSILISFNLVQSSLWLYILIKSCQIKQTALIFISTLSLLGILCEVSSGVLSYELTKEYRLNHEIAEWMGYVSMFFYVFVFSFNNLAVLEFDFYYLRAAFSFALAWSDEDP